MSWLGLFHTLLQYPIVASSLRTTMQWVDYVWLGRTAKYVTDDVVPVWHTNVDGYCPYCLPEFHPVSLKYAWQLTLHALGLLDVESTRIIQAWTPYLPRVCNDVLVVYYSRGAQWLAIVHSETDWKEFRTQLMDWIEEHRGKQDEDATFNVISILNKTEDYKDVTEELFPFLSPSGDFVSNEHRERILTNPSDIIVTEDIEGVRVEI